MVVNAEPLTTSAPWWENVLVGFGPTLWSTRRGETEYGVKAIPAGGFCDIAGMTSVEELAPDEHDRAMYKQKTWKRVAVLFAGPGMNFVVG